ncbi:MAG: glycosyltransferase family 2 protein [Terrimicrobiaceae bacterium]
METSQPDPRLLTVLIGTCNRIEHLQRCIDSLRNYPADFLQIVVSDAGSTDGTRIYLKTLKDIRVILEAEKRGQARALNDAAREVRTEFLCWISDDNVIQPQVLIDAVKCLQSDRRLGMLGLKVKDKTGPYCRLPFIGGVSETGIYNCNQGLVRREAFESVGGFDEELRDYMIDSDLTTKILLAGWDVALTKDVAIEHYRDHDTDSWISSASRQERIAKNRKIYFERYSALSRVSVDILLRTIADKERFRERAVVGLALLPRKGNAESVSHALRAYHLFLRSAFMDKSEVNPPGAAYCLRQSLPDGVADDLSRNSLSPENRRDLSTAVSRISKTLFRAHCAKFDVLSVLYIQDRSWAKALWKFVFLSWFDRCCNQTDRLLHMIRAVTDFDELESQHMAKDIHHQKKCQKLLEVYLQEYHALDLAPSRNAAPAVNAPSKPLTQAALLKNP